MARHLAPVIGMTLAVLCGGVVLLVVVLLCVEHIIWQKRVKHARRGMPDGQMVTIAPTVPRNKHRQPPQPGK